MKRSRADTGVTSVPRKKQRTNSFVPTMAMQIDTLGPVGSGKYTRGKKRVFVKNRGRKLTPKQKNEVRSLILRQAELKYKVQNQTATAITSGASISQVFLVGQAATDTARVGDALNWCGTLELNLQVVNGIGGTGDIYDNVRFILLQWHPNSTPATTDILLPGPSTAPDVYSVYNHDNRQQYTIMFDQVFRTVGNAQANQPCTTSTTTGIKRIRISTRGIQKRAQFNAGTTTGTNQFYILQVSDSALATHPTTAWSGKVFFRDS